MYRKGTLVAMALAMVVSVALPAIAADGEHWLQGPDAVEVFTLETAVVPEVMVGGSGWNVKVEWNCSPTNEILKLKILNKDDNDTLTMSTAGWFRVRDLDQWLGAPYDDGEWGTLTTNAWNTTTVDPDTKIVHRFHGLALGGFSGAGFSQHEPDIDEIEWKIIVRAQLGQKDFTTKQVTTTWLEGCL